MKEISYVMYTGLCAPDSRAQLKRRFHEYLVYKTLEFQARIACWQSCWQSITIAVLIYFASENHYILVVLAISGNCH